MVLPHEKMSQDIVKKTTDNVCVQLQSLTEKLSAQMENHKASSTQEVFSRLESISHQVDELKGKHDELKQDHDKKYESVISAQNDITNQLVTIQNNVNVIMEALQLILTDMLIEELPSTKVKK